MPSLNTRVGFQDKPILDDDDTGSVTEAVPNPTEYGAAVKVCSLLTRPGRRCRVIGLHQAWDAAIDGYVRWALFIGERMHYKYSWSNGQIAQPGDSTADLPSEVVCDGGQEISIRAVLPTSVSAPQGGNVTGRIRAIYEAY